jgi:hypothetical protein
MIDTINNVNKEVARELGIDEAIVKKINAFYWKGVKGAIASGEHTSIYLKNIGTLSISRNKLNKNILYLIKQLRFFKNTTEEFKKKTREEYIAELSEQLRKMLARRNDIAKLYRETEIKIKTKRRNATQH